MKRISTTKLRDSVGKVILYMMQEKIIITKHGQDIGVLISTNKYKEMVNLIKKLTLQNSQNRQNVQNSEK